MAQAFAPGIPNPLAVHIYDLSLARARRSGLGTRPRAAALQLPASETAFALLGHLADRLSSWRTVGVHVTTHHAKDGNAVFDVRARDASRLPDVLVSLRQLALAPVEILPSGMLVSPRVAERRLAASGDEGSAVTAYAALSDRGLERGLDGTAPDIALALRGAPGHSLRELHLILDRAGTGGLGVALEGERHAVNDALRRLQSANGPAVRAGFGN